MVNILTPKKAVRTYCYWCSVEQRNEVKLCPATDCLLHKYRLSGTGKISVKTIRKKCLQCGTTSDEVKNCEGEGEDKCALYDYRFGRSGWTGRSLTPEQRAAASERFRLLGAKRAKKMAGNTPSAGLGGSNC